MSLATAQCLRGLRESGALAQIIGYTGDGNRAFVESTGLYDKVLGYGEELPDGLQHILVDVAGDAAIYKRNKARCVKAFAVGGTHSGAESSVFTAFGPGGFIKMFIDMIGPQGIKH